MSAQEFCDVQVLGVVNQPDAEMRLLLGDMDRVLASVKQRLISLGITFDQALAIYNDIPVHMTAAEIADTDLWSTINRHLASTRH